MKYSLIIILLGACAQHPTLVLPDHVEAARVRVEGGTEIYLASHLWSGGPSDFESYLTPIAIDVHNNGTEPLHFRFEDVTLGDARGDVSNPLVVNLPRAYTSRGPINKPEEEKGVPNALHDSSDRLLGIGKTLEPSAVFMNDTTRTRPSHPLFSWDWSAYREWKLGLRGIELPRIYSQRAMLPVDIPPGQERHGFLYFPRLPEDAQTMTFTWNVERDDLPAKPVKIPLLVQR